MSVPRECPDPSTLAMFAECTLDVAAREAVQRHLADCPECPLAMAETVRFLRSEAEHEIVGARSGQWWWLAAAVAALCVSAGVWQIVSNGDPLQRMKRLAARSASRSVEGRLTDFAHAPFSRLRSDLAIDPDVRLRAEAEHLIENRKADPRSMHAAGVGFLLAGDTAKAVEILTAATQRDRRSAAIWNDLSVAYIALGAVGDKRLFQSALDAADRARALAPAMPAAHFNRAVALQHLGNRDAALSAYRQCSALEPRSSWADEATRRAAFLQK